MVLSHHNPQRTTKNHCPCPPAFICGLNCLFENQPDRQEPRKQSCNLLISKRVVNTFKLNSRRTPKIDLAPPMADGYEIIDNSPSSRELSREGDALRLHYVARCGFVRSRESFALCVTHWGATRRSCSEPVSSRQPT